MDWITQPETWIAFLTLVALELILGVDNVIFISILAGKLPQNQQGRARRTGIMLAVVTRILLLISLRWIIGLEEPLFTVFNFDVSGRDLILFAGGLFLIGKSTHEIHDKLEGIEGEASAKIQGVFWSVIIQIMLLDIVFSLDSVITAYFAMGFSVFVEMLNLRLRQAAVRPVNLRDPYKQAKMVTEGAPAANLSTRTPAKRKAGKKRKS